MRDISWSKCSAAISPAASNRCSIGKGVEEIRLRDDSGIYRIIYTARLADAVYVLHAFQKKSQATAKRDIDLARERLQQLREQQR
jgi:phage-related protein